MVPGLIEIFLFYKWFMYVKPILMRSKQLDLIHKAPVFQFFSSSLNGILMIKVYQQRQQFQQRMQILMNNSIRTYDIFWFVSRVFSVYMQYTALFASAIGIILTIKQENNDKGQFGQALAFFLLLSNFLHVTLRGLINMDTFMTSSERAHSILNLPKENIDLNYITPTIDERRQTQDLDEVSKENKQQVLIEMEMNEQSSSIGKTLQKNYGTWPQNGELIFENVVMRYKEGSDSVLKGVSFTVAPLERVAIVGRTGAGKSSIIQALFRMSEIDQTSEKGCSRILYDQRDTRSINLQVLRRNISIIPQTPFVFSGTIRRNIDPLDEFQKEDILRVLAETGLRDHIAKLPKGIETDMSDSVSIFSMGQKQLICLARVMLQNNKLVVLDEATSNVDMETDQMIQQLIKDKFNNCTIITIAHRLNTIADYDKVIVIDAGIVLEIDSPFRLLSLKDSDKSITNTSSVFAQMVLHTGLKNAQQIFDVSKKAYLSKKTD